MLDTDPLVPDKHCYLLIVSDTSFVPPQIPSALSPPGPQAACSCLPSPPRPHIPRCLGPISCLSGDAGSSPLAAAVQPG